MGFRGIVNWGGKLKMKRKVINSFDSKRLHKRFLIFLVLCFNLCSLLIGCSSNRATVREPSWLKVWGDPESDYAGGFGRIRSEDIAIDENGYVYVTGYYMGKVDLDPGPGILETEAVEEDPFLAKFDDKGNMIWIRTWGPLEYGSRVGGMSTYEIEFDSEENILIYSWYIGEYDFDPSSTDEIRTTDGRGAVYLSKFNQDGDFIEIITWPGISYRSDFSIDNSGGYLISGRYQPEPKITEIPNVYSSEAYDNTEMTIGRYDEDGSTIWLDTWPDLTIWNFIEDTEGNIFMSCSYDTEIDIDPGEGTDIYTPENKTNEVLLKLDQYGSFEWAMSWSDHDYTTPRSLILDDEGNIYVTGNYLDSSPNPNADWIPDIDDRIPDTQTVVAFLVKVDTAGNLLWEKTLEGAGEVTGKELIRFEDRIIIAGTFIYVTDFDPSERNLFVEPDNESDVFICEFNLNGEFQWVSQIGWQWDEPDRLTMEHISGISINDHGNIYVTGIFGKTSFLAMISPE